jgi:hypothetical protein
MQVCEVESLCLCAAKGVKVEAITEVMTFEPLWSLSHTSPRQVRSDPAHLEQCSHFLGSLATPPSGVVSWDSAGACKATHTLTPWTTRPQRLEPLGGTHHRLT